MRVLSGAYCANQWRDDFCCLGACSILSECAGAVGGYILFGGVFWGEMS